MQLYNMNEQLAYIVDQLDAMTKGSKDVLTKTSDKGISKMVKEFSSSLASIKDPLVVMTGDNYVGSAEPLLREKIASLYGAVAGYAGKPSNAQVKTMNDLDAKLQTSQETLKAMMPQLEKINKKLEKADLPLIKFKSIEDFSKA